MESSSRKFRALAPRAVPWLAALGLWLLFEIPAAFVPGGPTLLALRPTGDVLVLSTLVWCAVRARARPTVFRALGAVAAVALFVRVDFSAYFFSMRTPPLLYDQLFVMRHFLVLVSDLVTTGTVLSVLGFAALAVACILLIRYLLRRAAPLATEVESRVVGRVLLGAWALALPATAFGPRAATVPWIRWLGPELVDNVRSSFAMHQSVRQGIEDSPYRDIERLRLARKPDVFFFFVESYGRILAEDESTRPRWVSTLSELDARLSRAGWRSASAFSAAPVSGGGSWLAVGSIFFGARLRYQGVFQRFVDAGARAPSLPRFFRQQGYTTVNLAPSVRPRPGVETENRYGYDTYLRLPDLDYRGPKVGWGIVPDQYALGFAEERHLSRVQGPLFLHFHTVTSHVPWDPLPEYVRDWRTLNGARPKPPGNDDAGARGLALHDAYERSVYYDLRVLSDFLARRTGDALVILMGDHQPPFLPAVEDSFDVPVHVLARDGALLDELLERGFAPGMVPPGGPARFKHEGLFSLVVRALSRASGEGEPTEYHADGASVGRWQEEYGDPFRRGRRGLAAATR